ncbi:hypothetical protein ScPMuIL_004418 [Solemya velum]
MSGKGNREDRKLFKNLEVTSKCLAVILTPQNREQVGGEVPISGDRENIKESNPLCLSNQITDGKGIFEDFKLRNRTCYWNPALVESIKSLEYVGFVEPFTILVTGKDIHLENLRTAWGRRVLKEPENFLIERIGDINGIEMQVIPQTQFIPLPEALCLIIMDLNTHQVVATLDTIREKLHQYYKEMQAPSDQLIYDTLGNLIRERKVFHTGFGYFVVTPETYRLPTDDPRMSYHTTWMHYNPMYIPVFPQSRAPMKTISCQTSLIEDPEAATVQKTEVETKVDKGKSKLFRSQSVKKSKDKAVVKEASEGEFKRTTSLRYKEKSKGAVKDVNLKTSNINQDKDKGQKTSLLSKIFGRNKKKAPPPENEVEHATFSAQFPPPEWMWYQQQTERHKRTEEWVNQQMAKSSTWHFLQQVPEAQASYAPQQPHVEKRNAMTLPAGGNLKNHFHEERSELLMPDSRLRNPRSHRDHHGNKHISRRSELRDIPEGNCSRFYTGSILPTDPNVTRVTAVQDPVPIYTSTPHGLNIQQEHILYNDSVIQGDMKYTQEFVHPHPVHHRKSHKTGRKANRHSYSHYTETGGNDNDISVQYKGWVMNKHAAHALSRDSGVNCVGLDAGSCSQTSKDKPSKPSRMDLGKQRHSAVLEDEEKENDRVRSSNRKRSSHKHRHPSGHQQPARVNIEHNPREEFIKTEEQSTEVEVPSPMNDVPEIITDSAPTYSNNNIVKRTDPPVTLDSTVEDSEQSSGTVIAIEAIVHQPLDQDIKHLNLGDSGFCSPRNDENQTDKKQPENLEESVLKEMTKDRDIYSKLERNLVPNNRRCTSESTLLNSVKCIKDNNLIQHHYNQVYASHHPHHGNPGSKSDLQDYKEQISKKFNVSGDFEVVGVV